LGHRPPADGRDNGLSAVVVIVSFFLVMAMAATTAAFVTTSTRRARHEQDSGRALRAAESGIHDFLTRLRMNPDYLAVPGDADGSFCENPAAPTSDPIDLVAGLCGWDAATPTGWVAPDGGAADSFDRPQFHYEIVEVDLERKSVLIESTGRSSAAATSSESSDLTTVYQTLRARVAVPAPSDYLYWSDFELADPTDRTTYPDNDTYAGAQNTSTMCGAGWAPNAPTGDLGYGWQDGIPTRLYTVDGAARDCQQPGFTAQDVLEGPVHSNDMIRARGATFRGEFTTAYPKCSPSEPDYPNSCLDPAASDGVFDWEAVGASPPAVTGQWTPKEFVEVVNLGDTSDSQGVGCRYVGATRIVLQGESMRVWSADTASPTCGEDTSVLRDPAGPGVVVAIPADGLVYVANDTTSDDERTQIEPGQIGDGLPLGSRTASAITLEAAMAYPEKYSGLGNAYIQGSLVGRLTVATQAGIVITGDVTVEDPAADMLGLSAGTFVELYNPLMTHQEYFSFDGVTYPRPLATYVESGWPARLPRSAAMTAHCPADSLTVAAAVFAARGSFRVQNWNAGGMRGGLCVFGSVAQRFRGVVALEDGSGSVLAGYAKHYIYDPRLRRERPPHTVFLGDWWAISWTEERPTPDYVKEPR
jgi:Tfp pilus assembly protein PilX